MKKINLVIAALLVALVFVGCASKQDKIEIPTTLEDRATMTNFVSVTDASQIVGKWKGGYSQSMPGEELGIPEPIVISADVYLEYPVMFEDEEVIFYEERGDYSEYLGLIEKYLGVPAEGLWQEMLLQFESIDYTVESPYAIILPTYSRTEDFLPVIFISDDGKMLKIVAAPTLEIYLEKQK